MTPPPLPRAVEQGQGGERLPLPAMEAMSEAQRAAAQALVNGPRKAVDGPCVPLLRVPSLLDAVARLGEVLRFEGQLAAPLRELATCIAARHVGNQFEWVMHQPLALAAGIDAAALEAVRQGARPDALAPDARLVHDFATELLQHHGVSDATYRQALDLFGEAGVVELSTLVGYFVMVSWVMNVARTPSRPTHEVQPLPAWPA